MRANNGWLWLLAIVLLVGLAWGLEQVAFTPLQTGEVYPPFSSLRADPQGAMALYESLAALPGIDVERLYKQRQKLDSPRDAMLVLGVDPIAWSAVDPKVLNEYGKLVQNGGRLVIGFIPVRTPPSLRPKRQVEELWQIKLRYRPGDDDYTTNGIRRTTTLFFEPGEGWRILVAATGTPVNGWPNQPVAEAVEKSFGSGTIVLLADTYSLSNEGLREARDSGLIATVIGPVRRITFDENHFGVSETGSVTKLMRRYRLQGAVGVLIVVAALFVWRSASSLLPPRDSGSAFASSNNAIAGRDSLDGLSALLHRGVTEKQLMDTCLAEWSKSASRESRSGQAAAMKEEIARTGSAKPVDAYRAACRILTEKT